MLTTIEQKSKVNFLGGGFEKLYSNLGYNNWTSITTVIAASKCFKLAKTGEKWENLLRGEFEKE